MKILCKYFAVTVLCVLGFSRGQAASSDSAIDPANEKTAWRLLDHFVSNITTMRAQFRQILLDENRQIVQQASGNLALKRPGRFRWDYTNPYEQLIVSDGTRLWLYDADLAQVTVKTLDNSLASTPAMLLSGNANITDEFALLGAGRNDEVFWITLKPLGEETDFRQISLGFTGEQLQLMELEDSLEQVTRIILKQVESNPVLKDSLFHFDPPKGADVIGDMPLASQADR